MGLHILDLYLQQAVLQRLCWIRLHWDFKFSVIN